jgi:hypothetical protein
MASVPTNNNPVVVSSQTNGGWGAPWNPVDLQALHEMASALLSEPAPGGPQDDDDRSEYDPADDSKSPKEVMPTQFAK